MKYSVLTFVYMEYFMYLCILILKLYIMITRIDVLTVAQELGLRVSEPEIEEILSRYPVEQDNDPTATWNLVIENIIYNVIDERP